MKTVNEALLAHLRENVTTVCTCWKLTRVDGMVLGFTDHAADLVVDGIRMKASTGYTRSAIASSAALSVDNMDLEGLLTDTGISEEDCRAGLYDYAEVEVFLVNFRDLSMGKLILRRGKLGELTLRDGVFVSEIRGIVQALSRKFMDFVTPDCSVEFGSEECGIDKAFWTKTGSITSVVTDRRVFNTDLTDVSGWFAGGDITFDTGEAAGQTMEVKEHGTPPTNADYEQIDDWGSTKSTSYTVLGGPVIVTTGSVGYIQITALLEFVMEAENRHHVWSKWQYRKVGTTTWIDRPDVMSTSPTGTDSGLIGKINMSDYIEGLDANSDYEVQLQGRRHDSGSNLIQWQGVARLYGDPPVDLGDPLFGQITLFLPVTRSLDVGDQFTICKGCDKTQEACKRFNNFVNFRGFPHVPGMDFLVKTPEYRAPEV